MSSQHVLVQVARAKAATVPPDAPRIHTFVLSDGSTTSRGFANEAMRDQWIASQVNIVEVTR